MTARRFFENRLEPTALIIEVRQPVGSLSDTAVMSELDEILETLAQSDCRNVIVDFCQTAYFGSSMLEALRVIWNQASARSGKMVLCNVSPIGREILEVAKFDHLWPIVDDCAAALKILKSPQ